MKTITLTLSILALAAGISAARGHGGARGRSGGGGFSARGNFSRPLTRPTFAHSSAHSSAAPHTSAAARTGSTSHTGFVAQSSSRGVSSFGTARQLTGAGTGTPGGGSGGGASGGSGGTAAPAVATEQGGWATPGAKILTAGQQPVYSTPAGGGTFSVNGGGFVAINQGQAGDVGRAPGVTWGPADTPPSSGAGGGLSGSGAGSNGPAFNPAF